MLVIYFQVNLVSSVVRTFIFFNLIFQVQITSTDYRLTLILISPRFTGIQKCVLIWNPILSIQERLENLTLNFWLTNFEICLTCQLSQKTVPIQRIWVQEEIHTIQLLQVLRSKKYLYKFNQTSSNFFNYRKNVNLTLFVAIFAGHEKTTTNPDGSNGQEETVLESKPENISNKG